MSNYGELDPMPEHKIKRAFKGKREHVDKVKITDIAYPSQNIDIAIKHGSRDHDIVPDTVKITFNLDIEFTDKTVVLLTITSPSLIEYSMLLSNPFIYRALWYGISLVLRLLFLVLCLLVLVFPNIKSHNRANDITIAVAVMINISLINMLLFQSIYLK